MVDILIAATGNTSIPIEHHKVASPKQTIDAHTGKKRTISQPIQLIAVCPCLLTTHAHESPISHQIHFTCSSVTSLVSVWNVSNGCAWFSDSQIAFNFKFTNVYGRYWSRLPDRSSTCSSLQLPSSLGISLSLLSRKLSTPSDEQLPMVLGIVSNAFRSTFRLFSLVRPPMLAGSSVRKFSVKISSCRLTHLRRFHVIIWMFVRENRWRKIRRSWAN